MGRETRAASDLLRTHWSEAFVLLSSAVCALSPWHPDAIFWGGLPLALALFCVTSLRPIRTAAIALATALAVAASTLLPRFQHTGAAVPFGLLFAVAWMVGFAVGQRRRYLYALVNQERDRADREAAAERLRIARDLHDTIAHSMSVISVQAGFGRLVLADRPEETRGVLEAIEATGRETLLELRRMLGVLRDDTDEADLDPAPQLGDLNRLADRTRSTGLHVELSVTGQARPLPPGLETVVFRIAQEALTNVLKHADATTARVTIGFGPDDLTLTVVDDGTAAPYGVRRGRGISGMHERVALYGGTLQAGPAMPGGFRVQAHIPADGRTALERTRS